MAVPRKLVVVPNAATRELWRIAESGAIDELEGVLPQADINARNEHGMTALMRAAYHGRVKMVRLLLDHGADPNVARNDNFTALSLAAFFGHAEIVEMLMGHGANANVATRFGTSPYIWAKARSFGDVARCLEKRGDDLKKSVVENPAPIPTLPQPSPLPSSQPSMAVRTLKDPPEIWDLVHEAPRNFNASSAFRTRIGSMRGGFLIPVMALLLVIAAGIGAVIYLKDRIPSVTTTATTSIPAPTVVTQPPPNNSAVPETNNAAAPDASTFVTSEPLSDELKTTAPRRSRSLARSRASASDTKDQTATIQAETPPPATAPKINLPAANDAEPKKATAPLSSQMISPPKSTQPKAKVIQWP